MAEWLENIPFDQLTLGQEHSESRQLGWRDILLFAAVSGDLNPAHLDPAYAALDPFHTRIAHGMWGGAAISAAIGMHLPGPGTIYLDQSLSFRHPIPIDTVVTVRLRILAIEPTHRHVTLATEIALPDGRLAITGTALVLASAQKIRCRTPDLPAITIGDPPSPG